MPCFTLPARSLMKSKYLAAVFFSLFVFCAVSARSFAESASDEVWITVRVADKGVGAGVSEYYGTVNKKGFADMVNAATPKGFLRLSHAAWMGSGGIVRLRDAKENGNAYGYSDVMYLRADTVLRMIKMDESFAKEHLQSK